MKSVFRIADVSLLLERVFLLKKFEILKLKIPDRVNTMYSDYSVTDI